MEKKQEKKREEEVILANKESYDSYTTDIDEFMIYNNPKSYIYQHYRKTIHKILSKFPKNKTISVLDIAAGSGGISKIFFEDKRSLVTAVDLSQKQLDFFSKKSNTKRLTTMCSSVENLIKSKKKMKVDILMVASALHHFVNYKKVVDALIKKYNPRIIYFPKEPIFRRKGPISLLFTYIDDQFHFPYLYYKKKGMVHPLKRYFMIFGSPVIMPVLRVLAKYNYNPFDKTEDNVDLIEYHSNVDQSYLVTLLKKHGYLVHSEDSPSFFFKSMRKVAKALKVREGHFEIVGEKNIGKT